MLAARTPIREALAADACLALALRRRPISS